MNSLNDLRDSLDRHAGPTPDTVGLIERAQTGAARIRRRRRIAGSGVCAAAVVLAVAVAPAVLPSRPPGLQGAAPADRRTATQFTVDVVAAPGVALRSVQSTATVQYATVTVDTSPRTTATDIPSPTDTLARGQVTVHDPGTFDPTELRRGRPTTVQGHAAWLQPDLVDDPSSVRDGIPSASTVLGWQDPSGAWLLVKVTFGRHEARGTVVSPETEADLHTVADVLRIGPIRDIRLPYQFGYLPAGIHIDSARVSLAPDPLDVQVISLSGASTPPGGPGPSGGPDPSGTVPRQFSIDVSPTSEAWAARRVVGRKTTVAGHPAWYNPLSSATVPGRLAVEIGNCGLMINMSPDAISFAEQERIIAAMTVVDCTDRATWIPLLR